MKRILKKNEIVDGNNSVQVFGKKHRIIMNFIKAMGYNPNDVVDFKCCANEGLIWFRCVKEIKK